MSITLTPDRLKILDAVAGVDVSHYQPSVDWAVLKTQNIRFAFIKLSDGSQETGSYEGDKYDLPKRIAHAKENGMKIGYYHFARPGNANPPDQDANAEADFVAGCLNNGNIPRPDFPLVLDIERFSDTINWPGSPAAHAPTASQCNLFITTFVNALAAKGFETMFYSSPSFLSAYLPADHAFGSVPLWIANYVNDPNKMDPKLPRGWSDWAVWQYSQMGHLNGIEFRVDMNVMRNSFFNRY